MTYTAEVLRRFELLPHAGVPASAHLRGEAGSVQEGAHVVFHARLAGDTIQDCGFEAYGCPHTLAAASLAAELAIGQTPAAARQRVPGDLAGRLSVPPDKTGRLFIVQDALLNCLSGWENGRLSQTG